MCPQFKSGSSHSHFQPAVRRVFCILRAHRSIESEESHGIEVVISRQNVEVALKRFIFRGAGKNALVGVLCCVAYLGYDFSAGGVVDPGAATL